MSTVFAFIVVIGLLVMIHELGHYSVARLCGVKVLRFAIGFGPVLYSVKRKETEWALCAIPLGGYVKMLDERESRVPEEELKYAFNTQDVYKRISIVAAGPAANLVLAVVLYMAILINGEQQTHSWIGSVVPESIAARSGFKPGDRVVAIEGNKINSWQDIRFALFNVGSDQIIFSVLPAGSNVSENRVVVFQNSAEKQLTNNEGNIGFAPARNNSVIDHVLPNGVASSAGLMSGDRIVRFNREPVKNVDDLVYAIHSNPDKALTLEIERGHSVFNKQVVPKKQNINGKEIGLIGISFQSDKNWNKQLNFTQKLDPLSAGLTAVSRVWQTGTLNLKFLARMLTGQASIDNLSGPITIASVAGQALRTGLNVYIEFIAIISISLGVLNLLPIPVLDGGHLMYYIVELFRKKPVSLRAQIIGQQMGLAILFFVMSLALFNDFSRLFSG